MLKVREVLKNNSNDEGFSLIELVVCVGIMMVLMIGGSLSYGDMVNNTEADAHKYAVNEVFVAAVVYEADKYSNTSWETAAKEWNSVSSSESFKVWGTVDEFGQVTLGAYSSYDPKTKTLGERLSAEKAEKKLFQETIIEG